jgi:hypothetical protein
MELRSTPFSPLSSVDETATQQTNRQPCLSFLQNTLLPKTLLELLSSSSRVAISSFNPPVGKVIHKKTNNDFVYEHLGKTEGRTA